jgi:hypothetical protein
MVLQGYAGEKRWTFLAERLLADEQQERFDLSVRELTQAPQQIQQDPQQIHCEPMTAMLDSVLLVLEGGETGQDNGYEHYEDDFDESEVEDESESEDKDVSEGGTGIGALSKSRESTNFLNTDGQNGEPDEAFARVRVTRTTTWTPSPHLDHALSLPASKFALAHIYKQAGAKRICKGPCHKWVSFASFAESSSICRPCEQRQYLGACGRMLPLKSFEGGTNRLDAAYCSDCQAHSNAYTTLAELLPPQ